MRIDDKPSVDLKLELTRRISSTEADITAILGEAEISCFSLTNCANRDPSPACGTVLA